MRHLFFTLFLFSFLLASAQQRPKVGLALSGGGAKSMAQLGALRVIEQSGIKIDYISGTSMGAIIGAMYSMGYTVNEIEATLAKVNWDELLSSNMPKNRLPYLNRNDEKYLLNINLEDGHFTLPKAFNEGNYMLKIISYLTMRNHDVTDFSELNIPFLCMATDLETGESIAFDKGNLTDALRASVAFPSMFAPYEINGKLYVDGGVRNNLPIAILKDEKHMDYVIAIDVQGKLYNSEDIGGIVEVLEQVGSFQNALYYQEQKQKADIIITPEILEYSITDYEEAATLIKKGYEATLPFLEELKDVANQQAIITPVRQCCLAIPLPTFQVDTAIITGVEENEATLIKGKLHLKKPGSYSLKTLDRGLDLLYGSKKYTKANFQYVTVNNKKAVKIEMNKKSSRHSFGFGLHYDDDFSIALLANYTMRDAGILNSIFKIDLALSENPRGSISYIFERGYVPALGFRASFTRFQPRLYANTEPEGEINYFMYNADVFLHSTLGNNYTIGTGLKWETVELSETIPILGIESQQNQYLIYHAFIDFFSLNRSYKPIRGFSLKGKFNLISDIKSNAVKDLSSVSDLRFVWALKLSKKIGLNLSADGAITVGPNLAYPYNVFLGGLGQNYINYAIPFAGYRFMELIGRNLIAAKADIFYEFYPNHFVSFLANAGKLEPTIDQLYSSEIILDGYGLSYGYNSPIGPLELTVMGSSNHANIYTYISLGFWF